MMKAENLRHRAFQGCAMPLVNKWSRRRGQWRKRRCRRVCVRGRSRCCWHCWSRRKARVQELDGTPNPNGDILSPVNEGDALDGHMNLIDLKPKNVFCSKEKRITRRACPSGVLINPTRFVSAIVSGDASGLFSRRVKHKSGGCVCIDASGSMGATARNLSQLCALVPTATVGYYSGSHMGRGDLCVYADKEKRFSGKLPEEYMHGGNSVDLPAVRWMMKFPETVDSGL